MPLWTIYHTPGLFSDEEKHQLAARITDHYERAGLPRFYVVTIFNETSPADFYVGGERAPAGVRLVSESGIASRADVARVAAAGAHAVLVGEALSRSGDPAAKIRELLG